MRAFVPFLAVVLSSGCTGSSNNSIPPPGPLEPGEAASCNKTPIFMLDNTGTSPAELTSFDPQTMTFATLGPVHCPGGLEEASGPIAVDHAGRIYAVDNRACGQERIFRIDPTTLSCVPTAVAQTRGSQPADHTPCIWAMSFTQDATSINGETLFVLQQQLGMAPANAYALTKVDPMTSAFEVVGPLPVRIATEHGVALTGNSKGELYVDMDANASLGLGSEIVQIDTTTGNSTPRWQFNDVPSAAAFNYHTFAEWGGDFYFFVEPEAKHVQVVRFRPSDASTTMVAETRGFDIAFGVAVSTCAP